MGVFRTVGISLFNNKRRDAEDRREEGKVSIHSLSWNCRCSQASEPLAAVTT